MSEWGDEVLELARAALPPLEGELGVSGLREPVEVLRDRWGVPYLSAASLDDLWFAQGFVTASERLFQIDLSLRAANGRLSELFADLTLPQDRFARIVGFGRIGALEAARWRESSRAMVARFVEGVHAWISAMPAPPVEYALLASRPEVPEGLGAWAAAFAYAAWGLSGNWDRELLRVELGERLGPDAVEALLPPLPRDPPELAAGRLAGRLLDKLPRAGGQGSNGWAVAGSRTESGLPLLANDPHLLVQQPGAWFELHLRAPGYEAHGVAFPFAPGILVGATPHHAWGITNVTGDVQDLYEERLSSDGTAAEFDGSWEPMIVHREEIAVRGGDPVVVEVRETRHGPLLEIAPLGVVDLDYVPLGRAYALRWTATEGLLEPWSLVDVAGARSFQAFRDALRGVACPGQNVVYADVEGTIGYQLTGRYPIRRRGDGTAPVPGWTPEHEWEGFIPFEELPWSEGSARGYLVTANNRPHDEGYPHLIGRDFHASHRARRIAGLIEGAGSLTADDVARIQADTVSLSARALLPRLTALAPRTDDERRALELLTTWDGDERADSSAAAVYNAWVSSIARSLLASSDAATRDRYLAWREPFVCAALPSLLDNVVPDWAAVGVGKSWDDILRGALNDALVLLSDRLGADRSAWRWGSVHRVRFAHVLARMPGLARVLVAAEHEIGGDEQTIMQGGFDGRDGSFDAAVVPSWRMVIDLADVDRSSAVLPTGVSGNPASPHWSDQATLWIAGSLRPMPVTRPTVEAAAVRSLTLRPSG